MTFQHESYIGYLVTDKSVTCMKHVMKNYILNKNLNAIKQLKLNLK